MSTPASYPSLRGKVVAISGAASGLGLATTKLLHSMGAKLSLADINKSALDEVANGLRTSASSGSDDIITTAVDVSKSSDVDNWIQATVDKFGAINCAANFAGISGTGPSTLDTDDETWRKLQSINVDGIFFAVRAQMRAMAKQNNGGSIVNLASVAGITGFFTCVNYTSSKHSVIGITKVAAREGAPLGIRVSTIAPGSIDTPMVNNTATPEQKQFLVSRTPLARLGRADEIAKLNAFLLSDDSSFSTGALHVADGGMTL